MDKSKKQRWIVRVIWVGWVGVVLVGTGLMGCEISVTLPSEQPECKTQGTCKETIPEPSKESLPEPSPEPSPEPVPDPKPPEKTCKDEPGLICPKDLCQSDKECPTGQSCLSTFEGKRCVGEVDCGRLSEADCWKARPTCVLVYGGKQDAYICRASQNECERLDASACTKAGQCFYDPGFCYCPPELTCGCGGGPPPLCQLPSALCEGMAGCAEYCRVHFRCCAQGATCTDNIPSCMLLSRTLPFVCVQTAECGKLDAKGCREEPRCQWMQLPVEPGSAVCVQRP